MGTVAVPIDVLGGRPDVTNTPEMVYISGTNFPSDGYAFTSGGSKALYLKIGAELYGNSGNWTLDLHWYSRSGSTTGNVNWVAALAAITPADAQSVESKAFATSQNVTTTVNSTAKGLTLTSITVTNLDSVNAGDTVWLKLTRGTDTMTGDAILVRGSASYSDGNSGTAGSGDFVGPASATDTALVRFNGTTGKLGQNSAITVDGSGNLNGVGTINGVAIPAVWSPVMFRVFMSQLPSIAGAVTTASTAYFVYVGQVQSAITVNRVECFVTSVGAGTQTAEIGLFSSPSAPNRAGQTLTKIVATGTVDALTSAGLRRNTTAFAQSVSAGVHLWAGIRISMVTTQPQLYGLTADISDGQILSTASATAFTSGTTYSGALITASVTAWQAPHLRVTLD